MDKKKEKLEPSEKLMAKVLKTEVKDKYFDREIILKPVSYTDDLIIAGLLIEMENGAKEANLSESVIGFMRNIAATIGIVKFSTFVNEKGNLKPLFATMQDAYVEAAKPNVMEEFNRIVGVYTKTFELTKEEKKS